MTNDPWAAASATPATTPAAYAGAPAQSAQPAESPLAGAYGQAEGSSLLFNSAESVPALFNKTHLLGTERTGIIRATEDKQDQDYNAKLPKYWSASQTGGERRDRKITTDPIDPVLGVANRPVMVVHVRMETDYRVTESECLATGRDVSYVTRDAGTRVEVVGGFDLKAFAQAMEDARKRGITLAGPQDLVGKRLTVKRIGQTPPKSGQGNPSWVKSYRIDNA